MTISTFQFEQMRHRTLLAIHKLNPADARTPKAVEKENDLHDQIMDHCRACGYLVIHSRTDRATTNAVGLPDFFIFMPGQRVVILECKKRGGKCSTAQLEKLALARKHGFTALIVDNFEDAKKFIESTI